MKGKGLPIDDKEFEHLIFDVKYDMEQLKDPAAIGLLLFRLAKERELTNQLLRKILEKLEALGPSRQVGELGEVDKRILQFVERKGEVSAEDVRKAFNYRGRNAACARLNALYEKGYLNKKRVGKLVLYFPRR